MIINFKKEVKKLSAKTTVDSLRRPMFLDFPVVYHIDEQQKIANFLDEKSKIFDEAISKKEQLISKIELAKQSLISEVVTGKLKIIEQNSKLQSIKREKNELKPSGVEWLGDIPKEWKLGKLKYISNIKSGNTFNNNILIDNGKFEVFGGNGFIGLTNNYNVEGENIIIGRVGAYCGNVRYISQEKFITDNALILRLNKNQEYRFMEYLLINANLNNLNISNAQPLITGTKVLNLMIPILNITEQKQISKYLDEKLIHFDNTIEKTKQSIKKLKLAKEALISQAVTGKIEVL